MKTAQIVLVSAMMLALGSAAFAAEFWVIREKGRCVVVKKKPADASIIFKGPFSVRKEAEVIVKECTPRAGVVVEYWVVREPSGALIIVDKKPSDSAVIVKGPFRERKQAEVVVKESPRGSTAPPERRPTEKPKAGPERPSTLQQKAAPERAPTEQPKALPSTPQAPAHPGASKAPGGESEREKK